MLFLDTWLPFRGIRVAFLRKADSNVSCHFSKSQMDSVQIVVQKVEVVLLCVFEYLIESWLQNLEARFPAEHHLLRLAKSEEE